MAPILYITKYFSDGTLVSSSLLEAFAWGPTFPNSADPNATCVHWNFGKLINTRCNEMVDDTKTYYSGTSDMGLLTGSPGYAFDQLHRGYLCEARVIHTAIGNILCVFPFRYYILSNFVIRILIITCIFI